MRKFIQTLKTRYLVAASYKTQGALGVFLVPIPALSTVIGLVVCPFLGISLWIPFVSGLLCFSILAYVIIRVLLVADKSDVRMKLIKEIPRMKSEWILKERNAEIRKLIIENLGWPKILFDLHGKLIDGWNSYELYRIQPKDRLMREPFLLLKMKCPSSGSDYTFCVPPSTKTAKEAITWMNKGIAPEEFIKQT